MSAATMPQASSGRQSRASLKRVAFTFALLAGVSAAGYYGHQWWTVGRFIETTDDAYVGANVTAIGPHVSGFIAEILVGDNERVKAGQTLLRLDPRDLRIAADHADAVLQQRTAALAALQSRYALQQSSIRQATADLDAKIAQATFAHQEADRYRSLVVTSSGSQQEAQRTGSLDQQAQAAVAASRAGLASANQQLIVLDAQTAEAKGAIAQAQAELDTARLNLSYTEIVSPIDGYVGNRAAQVGSYVTAGGYLLTVVPAQGLWVDANFKEDQLARMAPGQAVTVVADVIPDRVFHGRVASMAPAAGAVFSVIPAENATGNFTKIVQRVPVRIVLDAGEATLGGIRPGLSIVAAIDTRTSDASVAASTSEASR
jgi:membrane fusion protein, multidrug efflux system